MKHAVCLPIFQQARPPVNVSISHSALLRAPGLPRFTCCWSAYGSRERGLIVSFRAPSACHCPRHYRVFGGRHVKFFPCLDPAEGGQHPEKAKLHHQIPKSSEKKEGAAKAAPFWSISSPFYESFCSALGNAINILAALMETTCMALCSMSEWISNSLVLEAKATFITYRSWLLEWFVAPLGQSRRERERFSPRFQMNTFVLYIRIYAWIYA